MIPTMYLRQVRNYREEVVVGIAHSATRRTPDGYRLQQWWARVEFDETGTHIDDARTLELGYGEWRDVPIVEDV